MSHNRYFKGQGEITKEMESVIVGNANEQRPRNKKGFVIVKLYEHDTSDYPFFEGWEELTDEQMIKEVNSDDWIETHIKPTK